MTPRPDWRSAYHRAFVRHRGVILEELQRSGRWVDLDDVDREAWRQAQRDTERAIRMWNARQAETRRAARA